jgi:hypothetical protein
MSVLLMTLNWIVVAGACSGLALAAHKLTVGEASVRRAKPGARRAAWLSACISAMLLLGAVSRLLHGVAAWVALAPALLLVCVYVVATFRSRGRRMS